MLSPGGSGDRTAAKMVRSAPVVGDTFAGYLVERELGRGGMGVVYLATQPYPERKVALKVLSPEAAADEAYQARFIRESNIAARIDQPHILPIYGAGEED